MAILAQPGPDDLLALRGVVQQKLGHCVLRLQAYELGLKAILAQHDVSVTERGVETDPRVVKATLGMLVGKLFGSFLTTEAARQQADAKVEALNGGSRVEFRMQIAIPEEEFSRLERDLKDFVSLRNELIHHFRERHDLGSYEGCQSAEAALNAAASRIERHYADLRTWAGDLQQLQQNLLDHLRSDLIEEWVATGRLPWAKTPIVDALREAAAELSAGEWAPVEEAGAWIPERYPEQAPANYGCSSWRQVLHESGLFELRYRETDGRRAAWYRARPA